MQPESHSVHSGTGLVAACQRQPMKHAPNPPRTGSDGELVCDTNPTQAGSVSEDGGWG